MISYEGRSSDKFHSPGLITSQRQYELDELIEVYKDVAPSNVLEIGTQDGGTLKQWLEHAKDGAKVINIDIRVTEDLLIRWNSWKRENVELITLGAPSQHPHVIERVPELMPDGIDFLFIDGDHTYEGAKADFENYGPMVNPGGVIVFHDLMTPLNGIQDHIQVGKLWREIQHAGYVTREIWASEYPDWGGIGVVYVQAQADLSRDQVCERQGSDTKVREDGEPGCVSDMRKEETRTGEAPV